MVAAYLVGAVLRRCSSTLALFVPLPGSELLLSSDGLRAQGLFKDPNVFGPFLIPTALILLEELHQPAAAALRPSTKVARAR